MLIRLQDFGVQDTLPDMFAAATTAIVPSLLRVTENAMVQYGFFGNLARVGIITGVFAVLV